MKTKILGMALLAFLVGVTLTATTARAAPTATTYPVLASCTSSGQVCTPLFDQPVALATPALVTLEFTTLGTHCSDISVELFVDGVSVGTSGPLGPGASTGIVNAGLLPAGVHLVSIEATGHFGGCNLGALSSWGGSLNVTTDARPVPLVADQCKKGVGANPTALRPSANSPLRRRKVID